MLNDRKPKALFIDDEKLLLELYSIKFAKNGYDVVVTPTAEKALTLLTEGYRPDVILFDITMPEMSGYEFLEKLNGIKLPRRCLKIALTNEAQDGEKARTIELGADAHLVKAEYTPAELVEIVRTMLERR
ncbi:MAG TPA: response regulator [Candidatus Paceibacterota bacterium]|nr:response regulator [Candidatus Paceibacterota bacterium]